MKYTKLNKPFEITSVCREDLIGLEKQDKQGNIVPRFLKSDIKHLSDSDMRKIASKLADDYREQLFWGSLEIITEHIIDKKYE